MQDARHKREEVDSTGGATTPISIFKMMSRTVRVLLLLLLCALLMSRADVVTISESDLHVLRVNDIVPTTGLRGAPKEIAQYDSPPSHDYHYPLRSLRENTFDEATLRTKNEDIIVLSQPLSFQIPMSALLCIMAIGQIALLITFYLNRSKRVLEFAQPLYVCMFIASGLITTCACCLYIYITNVGCIIREPIIFSSLSLMGAIIAARAWRISSLMSNPFTNSNTSRGENDETSSASALVERSRKIVMKTISALSGCDYSTFNVLIRGSQAGGRPVRVQINNIQMLRAISLLCVPQIFLQVVVIGFPMLRYTKVLSTAPTSNFYPGELAVGKISQYQCESSSSASWAIYIVSVLLVIFPFQCAYLLNLRPKSEMEKLPQIIDESKQIKLMFMSIIRLVFTNAPIIGMTYFYECPAIRSYTAIVVVIGVPLSASYYVAYIKLGALKSNKMPQFGGISFEVGGESNITGRGSAVYAVKMAEMYSKIGRTEETLELIDETLDVWKEGDKSGRLALGEQRRQREIVGAGFTKQEVERLGPEELEMILKLLIIKGDALMKLHGIAAFPLSAELNITAMKIFENCPASNKMKDISIM